MARWPNEDFSTGVWLSQWSADWPWTWDENRNSSLEYKKIYIIKRFTNRECSRACFHAASFCPSGGQSAKPPSQCITSNLNCSICPFFLFHVSFSLLPTVFFSSWQKMFRRIKAVSSHSTFSSPPFTPAHASVCCDSPFHSSLSDFLHPFSWHPIFHYISSLSSST